MSRSSVTPSHGGIMPPEPPRESDDMRVPMLTPNRAASTTAGSDLSRCPRALRGHVWAAFPYPNSQLGANKRGLCDSRQSIGNLRALRAPSLRDVMPIFQIACVRYFHPAFISLPLQLCTCRLRLPEMARTIGHGHMTRTVRSWLAALLLGFSVNGHAGLADPIYVASDGPVTLNYLGFEAAYTNTLWLHSPVYTGPIFVNKGPLGTPVGTVFDLGIFPSRTPLVFSIFVHNTGHTFFSGAAASNPDGVGHAWIDSLTPTLINVGFEDLWNGGDKDYNDLRFSVANVTTSISEPSALALVLGGLILAGLSRARTNSPG